MSHATTNGGGRDEDGADFGAGGNGGAGAGAGARRPLAHAIALRLLTAKGADAVALKGYVVRAGLAEVMVEVLEDLTRRVRGLRVEFEDAATNGRPRAASAAPEAPIAPGSAEGEAAPPPAQSPAPGRRTIDPGW